MAEEYYDDLQNTGSDDDAPEEVQLTSAKELAQEAKKQELAQQKAQQDAAKKKRQVQEAKRAEQKQHSQRLKRKAAASNEADEQSEEPQPSGRQADGGDGYALEGEEADFLPASVLEALQQDGNRQTQAAQHSPAAQRAQHAQAAAERKRKRIEQLKKGPVVVQVLKEVKKMASGTASNFLQEQLYGGRLKRSGEMLHPVGAAARMTPNGVVLGPARKFA